MFIERIFICLVVVGMPSYSNQSQKEKIGKILFFKSSKKFCENPRKVKWQKKEKIINIWGKALVSFSRV